MLSDLHTPVTPWHCSSKCYHCCFGTWIAQWVQKISLPLVARTRMSPEEGERPVVGSSSLNCSCQAPVVDLYRTVGNDHNRIDDDTEA
jgi:hypothetical protein